VSFTFSSPNGYYWANGTGVTLTTNGGTFNLTVGYLHLSYATWNQNGDALFNAPSIYGLHFDGDSVWNQYGNLEVANAQSTNNPYGIFGSTGTWKQWGNVTFSPQDLYYGIFLDYGCNWKQMGLVTFTNATTSKDIAVYGTLWTQLANVMVTSKASYQIDVEYGSWASYGSTSITSYGQTAIYIFAITWNCYGSLTITSNSQHGDGVVQFYTSIINQYGPLILNASSANGVYAGYSGFWNQYGSASIKSNDACIFIEDYEFTWNQFGSATLTPTNALYGVYWYTGTWNQQGDLTINSPPPIDGTPGYCSKYAIYFGGFTEWIQNGSTTITGSYCDCGIYSYQYNNWEQNGIVMLMVSPSTTGIHFLEYSTWEQNGQVNIDATASEATAISLQYYSVWNSNNNTNITLSASSTLGVNISTSSWDLQYSPVFTGPFQGDKAQCSGNGFILGMPMSITVNNTDPTSPCQITYLPELTIGQPQVVSTNGKTAIFSINASLSTASATAFTADATLRGSLAFLVHTNSNGFQFKAGTTVATLYGNSTFTNAVYYCGGSVSLSVQPSENYVIGMANTVMLSFSEVVPSSATKITSTAASMLMQVLASFFWKSVVSQ